MQAHLITLFAKKRVTKKDLPHFVKWIFTLSMSECEPASDFSPKQRENVDNYFYLGGRQFRVIPGHSHQGSGGGVFCDGKSSMLFTSCKIISYFTLVIPLVFIIAKGVLRSVHSFHVIDQNPAAVKIHSVGRMYLQRRRYLLERNAMRAARVRAATVIQGGFRCMRPEEGMWLRRRSSV